MEFKDRLLNYRNELKIGTKKEMSDRIGIARTLYSMLENGKREPSQEVLDKLLLMSNKPEEYWLYGIEEEEEYLNTRKEFKMTERAVKQLIDIGLIKDENFTDSVKDVLIAALKADVKHLLNKKQD